MDAKQTAPYTTKGRRKRWRRGGALRTPYRDSIKAGANEGKRGPIAWIVTAKWPGHLVEHDTDRTRPSRVPKKRRRGTKPKKFIPRGKTKGQKVLQRAIERHASAINANLARRMAQVGRR